MSTDNAALVRRGFEAFLRGDFDALREVLDPGAQWLWWEPIPGDCHDPDKILETLRRAWTPVRSQTGAPARQSRCASSTPTATS